jgi:hypothetical protein
MTHLLSLPRFLSPETYRAIRIREFRTPQHFPQKEPCVIAIHRQALDLAGHRHHPFP